jgi:pyridoxine 5-phosphate synthase
MMRLHVNVDHVATLRNVRKGEYPDPVFAAGLCELAGADGITAHLREDRRHIKDDDIERLRRSLSTILNLEMAATDEMIAIAERVRPDVITLVPERREELTTEGGLDVTSARAQVEKTAEMCARTGIKLSLFVEADAAQIDASRDAGARQVELHTGEYAQARGSRRAEALTRLAQAARLAQKFGLEVAAGHGLTRDNVSAIAAIAEIEELNIGHSVISDAVLVGMDRAVRDLRSAIDRGFSTRGGRSGGHG